jgi:cysteine-rich repeat protein/predicted outer membrane repeat protein
MVLRVWTMLFAIASLAGVSGAATFTVDTTLDDVDVLTGDGLCATAGGACTLRAAVQEADALAGPDTITLPAGTYVLTIPRGPMEETIVGQGDLDVTESLTVDGSGTGTTVIDANDVDRVFQVFGGTSLAVNDLTIRNGNALAGGGISNNGGALVMTNVVVTDCETVSNGLAGAIFTAGTLAMTGGALMDNRAGEGGAVYMNDGSAVLTDVTIAGNHSNSDGGAIKYHAPASSMTITGCTIRDNTSDQQGAGILYSESTLIMANSTVSGNRSKTNGGGIYANGPGTLNNVTVTANVADSDGDQVGEGGGIVFAGFAPGDLVVGNSIVAGNVATDSPDCSGTFVSAGYDLVQVPCTMSGDPTGNVLGVSAGLAPLDDNGGPTFTHGLLPGSPARNAANPAVPGSGGGACEATDQRGVARPQGPQCDIGALEAVPVCGDGVLDPGEACDDGNVISGDCCGGSCELDAAGSPCTDDESACTADLCDGAGGCTHAPLVDAGCATALTGRARVSFRTATSSKMNWRWKGADAVAVADFGMPTASTDYSVCVIDDVAGTPRLAAEVLVPSGTTCPSCWKTQAAGFRYKSGDHTLAAKLRAGDPGRSRVTVSAKTPALAASPLPISTPVIVRLQRHDAPGCWDSRFSTASRSTASQFKAASD